MDQIDSTLAKRWRSSGPCIRCGLPAAILIEVTNEETGERAPDRLACSACVPALADELLGQNTVEDHAADCVACSLLGHLMHNAMDIDAPDDLLCTIAASSKCRAGAELALDISEAAVLDFGELPGFPTLASVQWARKQLRGH